MRINGSYSATRSYDGAVCKLSSSCDVSFVSLRPQELSSAENQSKACRNNRQLGVGRGGGGGRGVGRAEPSTTLTLKMIMAFKIFTSICLHSPHFLQSTYSAT